MSSYSELHLGDAVVELRNQFRRTFDCLEVLRGRLESQLDSRYPSTLNPIRFNHTLTLLSRRVQELEAERSALRQRKEEVISGVLDAMHWNLKTVERLRQHSGLPVSGIPPNVTHDFAQCSAALRPFVERVRRERGREQSSRAGRHAMAATTSGDSPDSGVGIGTAVAHHCGDRKEEDAFERDTAMEHGYGECAAEMSAVVAEVSGDIDVDNTAAVTPVMFHSLSKLVRQRAKLPQLNAAYEGINDAFFAKENAIGKHKWKPVSIKALAKRGTVLSGQTGQSIVNCLRQLKLIQVSKAGISVAKRRNGRRGDY